MTDRGADYVRARLNEVESQLETARARHRADTRPLWEERDRLTAELAVLVPTEFPKRSRMTETQRKVERCPRCRGVIQIEGQS